LKPPKGTFKKEREYLNQWRHKFDSYPEWKKDRLTKLNII